jgi:hypothetical protein
MTTTSGVNGHASLPVSDAHAEKRLPAALTWTAHWNLAKRKLSLR